MIVLQCSSIDTGQYCQQSIRVAVYVRLSWLLAQQLHVFRPCACVWVSLAPTCDTIWPWIDANRQLSALPHSIRFFLLHSIYRLSYFFACECEKDDDVFVDEHFYECIFVGIFGTHQLFDRFSRSTAGGYLFLSLSLPAYSRFIYIFVFVVDWAKTNKKKLVSRNEKETSSCWTETKCIVWPLAKKKEEGIITS